MVTDNTLGNCNNNYWQWERLNLCSLVQADLIWKLDIVCTVQNVCNKQYISSWCAMEHHKEKQVYVHGFHIVYLVLKLFKLFTVHLFINKQYPCFKHITKQKIYNKSITGLHPQSSCHFAWQPSAQVSQTPWSSYLSHIIAVTMYADEY